MQIENNMRSSLVYMLRLVLVAENNQDEKENKGRGVCVCVCVLKRERDSEGNQERGNPSHLFQEHLLLLVSDLHVK